MSVVADHVLEQGLALPPEDRVRVAEELLRSTQTPEQRAIEEAWGSEAERRMERVRRGESHAVPAEEAIEEIRAWLKTLRK
jgi:putative addiction module component (TIGR02574 family)